MTPWDQLVRRLRDGGCATIGEIEAVAAVEGKTLADLVAALHSPGRPPRPGHRCVACAIGRLRTSGVKQSGPRRIRYLVCNRCGRSAGKAIEPCSESAESGLPKPRGPGLR